MYNLSAKFQIIVRKVTPFRNSKLNIQSFPLEMESVCADFVQRVESQATLRNRMVT